LRAAGAEKVWRETASGAKADRAQLRHVLDQLDAGDVLIVTRLDRLARSTRDLLNIWRRSPRRKPASDHSATHGPTRRRRTLTVLGGLAEFERELIRARTSEGRARAVANGVKLGRKPILTPHQRREAIKRVNAEKETLGEIARSYAVSRWTIARL
jgi:DNA invertase Pin-like site-specific DNA recombinase